MIANDASDGGLFSLAASEWIVLLVGVTLGGFITLFF
jgi:hypothetical protein